METVAAWDDITVVSRTEIARHFLALSNMVCFKYVQRIKLNESPESKFAILAPCITGASALGSSRSPAHAVGKERFSSGAHSFNVQRSWM